ncbi:MAG: HAD family hydrolase [Spirochaetales bacterium]|nr:HAD family hydrolase [Spirochaetales bacterium]
MIKAVIFDKDGTIINFDSFWVGITRSVIHDLLDNQGLEKNVIDRWLEVVGIHGEVIDPHGILAAQTGHDAAKAWYNLIENPSMDFTSFAEFTVSRFDHHSINQKHETHLFPGLKQAIAQLKARNMIIGVVTADTFPSTRAALKNTGLIDFVDYIGADDGHSPIKPHPFWGEKFCRQFFLSPEEVIMVGDTPTDMQFAKNCGFYAIGVSSGTSGDSLLAPLADEILPWAAEILKSKVLA